MSEMVNPYIAGAPVTETKMFFGREDVFDWIQNSLTGRYADHILVVHGQRRVGKTSVLKQLGNRLPEKYVPVFFDLQGRTHTTLDRFLWWLAREIVRVLKQERNITIPAPEKEVFTKDPDFFENHFLPELRSTLAEHVLLLTFDEFDNLEESEVREELARPLIDYLRRMMGQEGLNFIFSIGSSGRKLENMQAAYTEFFKTALYKKISFLSKEQTHNLVTRPVEGLLEYDPQAVERIFQIASGHPYFTQLTCHELFSLCQKTGGLQIREAEVEAVLDDVVERGTVNLKFVWDEASDIEKWTLAALANEKDTLDNRALAEFLRTQRIRFSEPDLTSGVLRLREKDILTGENRFVIHLLKLWLKKNRPIEQVREELTEVNPIANRYIEIGLEFQDAGQYDKAIENFRQALSVAPEHIQAQVNVALAYMAKKELDQAVVEFEKALAMDDEDVAARAGLCGAHLALGDTAMTKSRAKEAIQSYQKVLAINTEHTEARQRMAEINRQRAEKALSDGRDEEALAAFSEALKYTPEDENLARRYEQAKVEKRAKVVASLLTKAEKEQASRNWEGALSILQNALEYAPEDEKVKKQLEVVKGEQRKARMQSILARADRAQQAGRWGLVIAALEEYLSLEGEDAKVQKRMAEAREKLHQVEVEEARVRARSLSRQERFEEALAAWQEVLKVAPEEAESVQHEVEKVRQARALAEAYAEAQKSLSKKNYERAVGLLKGIIDQDVNYRDASRLFAQAVELRRTARKWWQNKGLWAGAGSLVVLTVLWFLFRPGSPLMAAIFPQNTPGLPLTASPSTPTNTPAPTPTPIPVAWSRLNSGQFIGNRDQLSTLVIDPTDPGVLYVGTQNAGIYKSIDGGLSWQPVQNGLGRARISGLLIDPQNPRTLYASVVGAAGTTSAYKTTDGGGTWQPLDVVGDIMESAIAMDPKDPQHLLFSDGMRIHESFDGGVTWVEIKEKEGCPNNIINMAISPSNSRKVFVVGECNGATGVVISEDGGQTWAISGLRADLSNWLRFMVETTPQGEEILYANIDDWLRVSADGGANWTQTTQQGCFALAVDPRGGLLAACNTGLVKTADGGITWEVLTEDSSVLGFALAVSPQSSTEIFSGKEVLWVTRDGGQTWSQVASGLGAARSELVLDPAGSTMYLDSGFLYRSSDGGRTWDGLSPRLSLALDADGKTIYSGDDTNLLRSTDQGETWEVLAYPSGVQNWWDITLTAHPTRSGVLYLDNQDALFLSVTTDGGASWNDLAVPGDPYRNGHYRLYFGQGSLVYLVNGGMSFYSEDESMAWRTCSDVGWPATTRYRMAVDPRNSDRVYISFSGQGIYRSDDHCQNWSAVNTGLGSLFVNAIAIDPNNPDTIYAGTDGGAYVSFNGGQTWGPINDGLLGATVVYSIVVDKDSNVYAATPYGVFLLEK